MSNTPDAKILLTSNVFPLLPSLDFSQSKKPSLVCSLQFPKYLRYIQEFVEFQKEEAVGEAVIFRKDEKRSK